MQTLKLLAVQDGFYFRRPRPKKLHVTSLSFSH